MFALLLPLVAVSTATGTAEGPIPVASRIEEVTLYASSALVRRAAELPGGGSFVVQGLPWGIDRDNVRVRCRGGDVVSVEVRERIADAVQNARLQELRERLRAAQRDAEVLQDGLAVLRAVEAHLRELMNVSAAAQQRDVQAGKTSLEAWSASLRFVTERMTENAASVRAATWKLEEKKNEIDAITLEVGRFQSAGSPRAHDVVVEVAAAARAALDVEYLIGGTGWRPAYDLRASKDLQKVELTYRARIWQQTGEDWDDVELALSTARPQKGAQGPEPQPVWLSIAHPRTSALAREQDARGMGYAGGVDKKADAAETELASLPARPFASVESQGLSVHFRLARKESIESREQPTTVLVGSFDLGIVPERVCVPSLDTTVWLRARTKNTSPWVLLPGTAAVFFGADYIGPAEIETVQTEQELVLHLGADPGITATRTQTQDLAKGPGFLSSKSSKLEGWRIHLVNHGTVGTAKDGSAEMPQVIVREVLPKAKDDRIEVEIAKAEPKPSDDERWKQDRDEKGILTWVVRVPPGEKGVDVLFETNVSFPKGLQVTRE